MKRYELFVNVGVVMMYATPLLMSIMVLVFLYISFTQTIEGPPLLPFALFALGSTIWILFRILRMPHAIQVNDDGRIEFMSRLGRRAVTPEEIFYVGPDRGQIGFLVIRSEAGRIHLLNQFNGLHRFLTDLETANPGIEFRGC